MEAGPDRLPTAFILPVIQLIVGLLLFMALLNGQRELTVLALIIFTMVIGTKIWSRLSGAGIRCEVFLDKQRMFPREPFRLIAEIRNQKILPVWIQMAVRCGQAIQPEDAASIAEKGSSLLWYQRLRFQWHLTACSRGVFEVGPPELKTGDLFGFYPEIKKLDAASTIIVYPRLVPLKPVAVLRRDFFGTPGSRSPVDDPVYIYGLRDYQHGRPARSIHWKASARHLRVQEKLCAPAEQEKILIIIEVAGFPGDRADAEFERCLEVAASTAVEFDRSGYGVGVATDGLVSGGGPPVIPVSRNRGQLPKILELLARVQMKSSAPVADILRQGSTLPWGVSCITFLYDSTAATERLSDFCRLRHIPQVSISCRMTDAGEKGHMKPACRLLTLDDVCRKGSAENEG